ncbi:MAG: exodeoxyribonuclease VII large subunit [bacterium]|nr:exodeoxyribonuclease VII large subunit [bacterium]
MQEPVTISEFTREVKLHFEAKFNFVNVIGEISNFKHHSSGHFYFTLKDDKAQVSANMWSSKNQLLRFTPSNGMKVIVKGRVTVYESKGTYQIDVFEMQPAGEGELQVAFEKLKQKLFAEGMFDVIHKKPLPDFPERVGIITSETGAALQDFIRVTNKRYPLVKLYLFNASMQGRGAAQSISSSIKKANKFFASDQSSLDLIILARGGGSIEDLWCFNEEIVAREIFRSGLPVVSAVGHEIDFTISDFVADLRAPTPSAAAEMIFPDILELKKRLNVYAEDLKGITGEKFNRVKKILNNISTNYYFNKPMDILNEYKLRIDDIDKGISDCLKSKLLKLKARLDSNEKLLNSLGPEMVLKRGYTIITKKDKIINSKKLLKDRDKVGITFFDGDVEAVIKDEGTNYKIDF